MTPRMRGMGVVLAVLAIAGLGCASQSRPRTPFAASMSGWGASGPGLFLTPIYTSGGRIETFRLRNTAQERRGGGSMPIPYPIALGPEGRPVTFLELVTKANRARREYNAALDRGEAPRMEFDGVPLTPIGSGFE